MRKKKSATKNRTTKPVREFDVYVETPDQQHVTFGQLKGKSRFVLFAGLHIKELTQLVNNVRGCLHGQEHWLYIKESREEPDNLYDILKRESLWYGEVPDDEAEDMELRELLEGD